ncbi:hypothetical protein Ae331Ps2_6030c [Pseudonocardia sp. Ae331_Ps2]|nr:hypothetical protein Ae331Ps2_6030c [Pseudonocardia sp. Ae331_Ps2]
MYKALSELGVGPLNAEQRRMVIAPANARAVFSDHPAVGLGARNDATVEGGCPSLAGCVLPPADHERPSRQPYRDHADVPHWSVLI